MSTLPPSEPEALAPPAGAPARSAVERFGIVSVAALGYLLLSAVRYETFRAGDDLTVFDQAVYLISRGARPVVTFLGFHILADHGAAILYPIALLYRIYPSVYWLLGLQAAALAAGALPLWRLARLAGLSDGLARAIAVSYLTYPVVLGSTLFDFHPETLAVPALLMALLYARQHRPAWFALWVLVALPTKEPVALAVAAMGAWLLLFERNARCGCLAVALGVAWFFFATRWLIPHFGQGHQFNPLRYLSHYGSTTGEVVKTLLLRPQVPLRFVASKGTVFYLAVIFVPVAWGLSPRRLAPLLGALPAMAVNLLSDRAELRYPFNQYSLTVVPFLFLAVVDTLASGRGWLRSPRAIGIWITCLAVAGVAARASRLNVGQAVAGATNAEKRRVMAMVSKDGGVLTTQHMMSHLSHRRVIGYVADPVNSPLYILPERDLIDEVLLDFAEDDMRNAGDFGRDLLASYERDPAFRLVYQHGSLYLFRRDGRPTP